MSVKRFFKVVANRSFGKGAFNSLTCNSQVARGIRPARRGQSIEDFMKEFMNERGIFDYELLQRGTGSWVCQPLVQMDENDWSVITYHFIELDKDDLGYHAKDLDAAELSRDFNDIWRALHG